MKKINHIPQNSKNAASIELAAFFCVFRFLLSRGINIHLPSQENEIQELSRQPVAHRLLKKYHKRKSGSETLQAAIIFLLIIY
ncbi:hypothetical protein [uncultured Eubacterium sp.]|uniref:hypothetical protein n=1 Tax=uncultured Eubacterium sp. TaxID=165185 RepID=UPI002622475A|nr:hypothetical protein [uncultured Eubacterium sp.]